jgi:hypothetical protein
MLKKTGLLLLCLGLPHTRSWAEVSLTKKSPIPDGIESVGGHGEAFSNSGMAALTDISAVRLNPAMMTALTAYQVAGTIHWPSAGRNYYQVGVVDPTTSPGFAAGVMMTTSNESLPNPEKDQTKFLEAIKIEDPGERRFSIGLAQAFAKLSVGISFIHAQGYDQIDGKWEKVSGSGLGGGIAALLSKEIRLGASVENANGEKIKNLAPKTVRYGIAGLWGEGTVTTQIDYKERDRIQSEVLQGLTSKDRSITGSATATVQNTLRLIVSYGESISERPIRFAGGGIAVVNNGFTLAYHAGRKDLSKSNLHQAVSIGLDVRM